MRQALVEFEADICECGAHRSVADTDPDEELDLKVCPRCKNLAQALRALAKRDEEEAKHMPEGEKPADGRRISLKPKSQQVADSPHGEHGDS